MKHSRRLRAIPGLIAVLTVATLGSTASPASAASTLNSGTGAFTAVAAATYVPPDPITSTPLLSANPCSVYTAYEATLKFSDNSVATIRSEPGLTWAEGPAGTYDEPLTVTPFSPNCSTSDAVIGTTGTTGLAFVGTLVRSNGDICTLDNGTYQRGLSGGAFGSATANPAELNVRFEFGALTGACGTLSATLTINTAIPRVDFGPTTLGQLDSGSTTVNGLPGPVGIIGGEVYDNFVGGQEFITACAGLIAPPSCLFGPANAGPVYTTP